MIIILEMITLSSTLTVEVDLGVNNSHVTRECICTRECLLLATVLTTNLLLLAVVDCILMTSEIVWSAEDAVAGLAS